MTVGYRDSAIGEEWTNSEFEEQEIKRKEEDEETFEEAWNRLVKEYFPQ